MTTLTDFLLARIAEDEARRGLWEKIDSALRLSDNRAFWSRKRRLAHCEAKRRIVAIELPAESWDEVSAGTLVYDAVLALLALPYANHPDYREEWRPSPPSGWIPL